MSHSIEASTGSVVGGVVESGLSDEVSLEGAVEVEQEQDENELACQGITMLLNNEWKAAEELFQAHK